MTSFPGTIYDGHSRSLDSTAPDLVEDRLDIPQILMVEAVRLMLAGRRADPGAVGVRLRKPTGPG